MGSMAQKRSGCKQQCNRMFDVLMNKDRAYTIIYCLWTISFDRQWRWSSCSCYRCKLGVCIVQFRSFLCWNHPCLHQGFVVDASLMGRTCDWIWNLVKEYSYKIYCIHSNLNRIKITGTFAFAKTKTEKWEMDRLEENTTFWTEWSTH